MLYLALSDKSLDVVEYPICGIENNCNRFWTCNAMELLPGPMIPINVFLWVVSLWLVMNGVSFVAFFTKHLSSFDEIEPRISSIVCRKAIGAYQHVSRIWYPVSVRNLNTID